MSSLGINLELLKAFEKGLDPAHLERSKIPARVLGFGEISTVLEIEKESAGDLAYKRLPMFSTEVEAQEYESLFREYTDILGNEVGLRVVPSDTARIVDEEGKGGASADGSRRQGRAFTIEGLVTVISVKN